MGIQAAAHFHRRRLVHRADNKSHFVDYQTCVTAGGGHMVCTGIAEYRLAGTGVFSLGGIAVVEIESGRIEHEAPVTTLAPAGRVVTYNAVHLEIDGSRPVPSSGSRR
ncbi:hypothetical protein GCM10010260_78540 [Streptomyces filipinensis]|uniref:Uncharacterized protein n=1 Tax=Streptomyces filipinensis TaxID=66887 RepID=A0A918MG72_9ACTN|nr:DUF6454 family protein [Streptomyces filipinensis]GGV26477.1 hypothetical protein GCM10010260_78540 [Streptomyces filipinensis]